MSKNTHNPALPLWGRVLIGAALGVGAMLGVGWYFADRLVHVRPVRRKAYPTRVLALEEGHGHTHVTLTSTPSTRRPGSLILEWETPGGTRYAQLGPLLRGNSAGTVRELRETDAPLRLGQRVRASTIGRGTPAQRGMPHLELSIPGDHGPMPAWLVPPVTPAHPVRAGAAQDGTPTLAQAAGTDWVIVTHGYGGLRQDALRILPTLVGPQTGGLSGGLGLTALVITYRNAEGAPPTPERKHRLSAEEWQDLEAAVQFAVEHGARRILLFGFRLGAGISLAFLRYSRLADRVTALLLDSPPLEWRALITHHALRYRVPIPFVLSRVVAWLTVVKSKQDFDAVDHLSVRDTFHTPMLVVHGSIDKTVPVAQVESFVHARPDIVEYHRFEGAQHERAWNQDPARYEAAVKTFVRRVLDTPQATHTTGPQRPEENHHA